MAITNTIVNKVKELLINGEVDWTDDTIKVMLLDDSHVTDIDAQEYINDVSTNEISGSGYTAGGATLAGKTVTQDNTNDLAYADANGILWTNATFSAWFAVVYKDTGTPATSPIICIIDFDGEQAVNNGEFNIVWNAGGIFKIS